MGDFDLQPNSHEEGDLSLLGFRKKRVNYPTSCFWYFFTFKPLRPAQRLAVLDPLFVYILFLPPLIHNYTKCSTAVCQLVLWINHVATFYDLSMSRSLSLMFGPFPWSKAVKGSVWWCFVWRVTVTGWIERTERIQIACVSDAVELQWSCVVCLSAPYHKCGRDTQGLLIKSLCSL